MRNIVLAAATAAMLAFGTAWSFAADNAPDSQTGTEQSGKRDQGDGVANRGSGGCADVLKNPPFHSSAAVASCHITDV
jgi:hypothetical protein